MVRRPSANVIIHETIHIGKGDSYGPPPNPEFGRRSRNSSRVLITAPAGQHSLPGSKGTNVAVELKVKGHMEWTEDA